jgi:hypothetical protein
MKAAIKRLLRRAPGVKAAVKRIILGTGDLIPAPKMESPYPLREVFPSPRETFFGYHDVSPESPDSTHLLLHEYDAAEGDKIRVSVIETKSGRRVEENLSRAFNFQLGSRALWLSDREFVYNDLRDGDVLCTRLRNLVTGERKTFDTPVYGITKSRKLLGVNFERLRETGSEYGYQGHCAPGLWIKAVTIETGHEETLLTDEDLRTIPTVELTESSVVNHILPHPERDKFIFILRTFTRQKVRKDWLFLYDMESKSLRLITTGRMVSHYTWVSESRILAYASDSAGRDGFFEIDVDADISTPVDSLKHLTGDGHPQFNEGRVVVDSYPNFRGVSKLWILDYSIFAGLEEIARVRHGSRFSGPNRCDLHPRWSRAKDAVYFDSVATGARKLYVVPLPPKNDR